MLTQFFGTGPGSEGLADSLDIPAIEHAALAIAPVADHGDKLFDAERAGLDGMSERRRCSFSTGRYCAHVAFGLLGITCAPVTRDGRLPVWPDGISGSITHSQHYAAAVISDVYRGIGIDLEALGRVPARTDERLFTEAEQNYIQGAGDDPRTHLFGAKEAGYKAVFPQSGTYIGFQEATIQPDGSSDTFDILYHGENRANQLLHEGRGYWRTFDDQLLTVFCIA